MYVCMSITGLQLKYRGLCIVYVPFCRVPLMVPSFAMEDSELTEDRRLQQAREYASPFCPINDFPLAVREAHDAHVYS